MVGVGADCGLYSSSCIKDCTRAARRGGDALPARGDEVHAVKSSPEPGESALLSLASLACVLAHLSALARSTRSCTWLSSWVALSARGKRSWLVMESILRIGVPIAGASRSRPVCFICPSPPTGDHSSSASWPLGIVSVQLFMPQLLSSRCIKKSPSDQSPSTLSLAVATSCTTDCDAGNSVFVENSVFLELFFTRVILRT